MILLYISSDKVLDLGSRIRGFDVIVDLLTEASSSCMILNTINGMSKRL
jgi:hypothetical protein